MDSLIAEKVKNIVLSLSGEDGWAKLSAVGIALEKKGIGPNEMANKKVKPFLETMNEFLELSKDESLLPIVRVRSIPEEKIANSEMICENSKIKHIFNWANINLKIAILKLKNMALSERWSYKEENKEYPNPILAKYFKWTFVKLMRENKILYSNSYAAFNTGLVDKFYKPIYAVFDKNKYPKQPWHFIDFCVAGSSTPAARILTDNFSTLPLRATYINRYEDVIYDSSLPVDVNWEHIILENIERMPVELLRPICHEQFDVKDCTNVNAEERELYYNQLRDFLGKDPSRLSYITYMMNSAVETAKSRVEWNYKTAIPVYYPTDDSVHLILPLSLNINQPDEISLALVMRKTQCGRYRAVTIFTLDMAYSNARLITKPSSDWLIAEQIGNDSSYIN